MAKHEDDGLESLLEDLKEGQEHSAGQFTLDPVRAKEMLGRYQLSHPQAFGVHLVAAAVASGAANIDIRQKPGAFSIRFDGKSFEPEEIIHAASSLFASKLTPEVIRLQDLAVALHAASGLGLDLVEVLAHGAHESVLVTLKNEPTQKRVTATESQYTTEINLTRTKMGGRIKDLFIVNEANAESLLIKSSCCWAPATITLNGQQLPKPSLPQGALLVTKLGGADDFDIAGALQTRSLNAAPGRPLRFRGVVLYDLASGAEGLNLIVNGITYLQPWAGAWGLLYCQNTSLHRDLSQLALMTADVDELRLHLLADYFKHLAQLCQSYPSLPAPDQARARSFLLQAIQGRPALVASLSLAQRKSLKGRLLDVPMMPLVGGQQTSLRALGESNTGLLFCASPWDCDTDGVAPPVDARDPLVLEALRSVYPELALEDGDQFMQTLQMAQARRRQWEKEPLNPPTLNTECWVKLTLTGSAQESGWRGEVGLPRNQEGPPSARVGVYFHGHFLEEFKLKIAGDWPSCYLLNLQNDALKPDALCAKASLDKALMDSLSSNAQLGYLALLKKAAREWQAESLPRCDELNHLFVASLLHVKFNPLLHSRSRAHQPRLDALPALGHLAVFALAADEESASWNQLYEQFTRVGAWPIAPKRYSVASGAQLVTWTPVWLANLLECFFTVRDASQELLLAQTRELNRLRWLEQTPGKVELPAVAALAKVSLEGELNGEMAALAGTDHLDCKVFCYRGGRSLGYQTVASGALPRGLTAALESDSFEPDSEYASVLLNPALEQIYLGLRHALPRLLEALAAQFPDQGLRRRELQSHFFNCLSCARGQAQRWIGLPCLDLTNGEVTTLAWVEERLKSDGIVPVLVWGSEPQPLADFPIALWFRPTVFVAFELWLGAARIRQCQQRYQAALHQGQVPPAAPEIGAERVSRRLRLARGTSESQAPQLWQELLLADPWGKRMCLSQLSQSYYGQGRLFFWPSQAPPPSPLVLPEGYPLPVLSGETLSILSEIFSQLEDYRPRAQAATELLQQPCFAMPNQPDESRLNMPNGWLSAEDSGDRCLTVLWRERLVLQRRTSGRPGYRSFIHGDAWPLSADGSLDSAYYARELELAERELKATGGLRLPLVTIAAARPIDEAPAEPDLEPLPWGSFRSELEGPQLEPVNESRESWDDTVWQGASWKPSASAELPPTPAPDDKFWVPRETPEIAVTASAPAPRPYPQIAYEEILTPPLVPLEPLDAGQLSSQKFWVPQEEAPGAVPSRPIDPWNELWLRLNVALFELHGPTDFFITSAVLPAGWKTSRKSPRTEYTLNFQDLTWRRKLQQLSTPWLVAALWLGHCEDETSTADAKRLVTVRKARHRLFLRWLEKQ